MITQTNILQSIIPTINGKIGKKFSNWGEGWGCPQLGKNSHIFPFLFLEDVPKRYFDNKDFKQLKMTRFFCGTSVVHPDIERMLWALAVE